MERFFAVVLIFFIAAAIAQGETLQTQQTQQTEAFQYAKTDWVASTPGTFYVLIDAREPTKRRHCTVRIVSSDAITCAHKLGKDTVIPRNDVLALIDPRDLFGAHFFVIWTSASAALIAAGFFAGPAAPALWVVGGLGLLVSPIVAMGVFGDMDHDSVVYYAPGPHPNLPLQ